MKQQPETPDKKLITLLPEKINYRFLQPVVAHVGIHSKGACQVSMWEGYELVPGGRISSYHPQENF